MTSLFPRLTLTALLLILFCPLAIAASAQPAPDITGTWYKSAPLPDGNVMTVAMNLSRDGTFNGQAVVNGTLFWEFAGQWQANDREIVYVYDYSTRPLPGQPFVDTDDILAIHADTLVLRSRLSGKTHEFRRAR